MINPASYFEIPVVNMQRAIDFYSSVFDISFEEETFDDLAMAYFPYNENASGSTGALVCGEIYIPTTKGIILYLHTDDIDQTMQRAIDQGSLVLFPIHRHEKAGFAVAEFQDSEGNRIGLHQRF